jgi:hypothetical protein
MLIIYRSGIVGTIHHGELIDNLLIQRVPLFLLRRLREFFLFQALAILVVEKFTKDEERGAKYGGT